MLYTLFLTAAACAAILGVMVLLYSTVRWDAEHLVTSSIFWGSTGRLIRTLTHELSIWAWGFMPHTWTPQNPSRKDL